MEYDYIFYIGRFQPFHNGHEFIVDTALTLAKHVVVLCGQTKDGLTNTRNPWPFDQVKKMISDYYPNNPRILVQPLRDKEDDQQWQRNLQAIFSSYNGKKALIGHHKDQTSYYLDLIANLPYIEVANYQHINGTDIRALIQEGKITEAKKLARHLILPSS